MRWASRAVTRPWSTASPSTSSMRSREIMTISIGRIRFLRSASRSSATVLASTPALRGRRAVCGGLRRPWSRPLRAPSAGAPRRLAGLASRLRACAPRTRLAGGLRHAARGFALRRSTGFARADSSWTCSTLRPAALLRHVALLSRWAADYRTNSATTGAWSDSLIRSPPAVGQLALRRRQLAGPLDHPQAAREQVVDGAAGRSARPRPKRSRSCRERRRVARRAQVEVAPEDERVVARPLDRRAPRRPAPRRAARAGSPADACRFATHTPPARRELERAHCIRRRSGRAAPASAARCSSDAPGARTRIWFEPPSPDAIRSGFQSAPARLERRPPVARREHAHAARRGCAGRARRTSAAAPPAAGRRPTRGRRARPRTRRAGGG